MYCVPARAVARAIAKSVIFTRPSAVTITFSGFMSRWTIPAVSACVRAARIASSTPAIWATESRLTWRRKEPRATSSITMYGVPPCSKYSCKVTMFRWFRVPNAGAQASRRQSVSDPELSVPTLRIGSGRR